MIALLLLPLVLLVSHSCAPLKQGYMDKYLAYNQSIYSGLKVKFVTNLWPHLQIFCNEFKWWSLMIKIIFYLREGSLFMGWGAHQGGAKNFGRVAKWGRKILDMASRGGEKIWTSRQWMQLTHNVNYIVALAPASCLAPWSASVAPGWASVVSFLNQLYHSNTFGMPNVQWIRRLWSPATVQE